MCYPASGSSTWPAEAATGRIAAARRFADGGGRRLRPRAARARARARGRRGARGRVRRGRRAGRSRSRTRRSTSCSRPSGRCSPRTRRRRRRSCCGCAGSGGRDRHGELDPRRPRRRRIVRDHRQARAAAARASSPPSLWGTEERAPGAVRRRCVGAHARARVTLNFRYRSPEHWLAFFRDLLRPDDDGLRTGRRRGRGGARGRPPRGRARARIAPAMRRSWRPPSTSRSSPSAPDPASRS